MQDHQASDRRRTLWAGGIIGFALGGFFDGILLHQLLQWHHLFSLVPGERWRDIGNQILMDGWFHVFHYVIACVGLWLLWTAGPSDGGDRRLLGAALLGFGVWQIVDIVGFHWLLMIHRIRVGVANPLAYDLGWLIVFGAPSLAAAFWLWRRPGGDSGPRPAIGLTATVLFAGLSAASGAPGKTAIIVFRPGTAPAQAFAAASDLGPILWADPDGNAIAVAAPASWTASLTLYRAGAVLVSNTPVLGGCLAWSNLPRA